MKKLFYLFLMVCLLMLSCQQDFGGLGMEEQLGNGIGEPGAENQTLINQLENNNSAFEDRLQWVSFITARVLRADTVARNELLNLMNEQDIIHFSDLVGNNAVCEAFNTRFQSDLYRWVYPIYHETEEINPETEMDKPRETILIPSGNNVNNLQGNLKDLVQNAVNYFIEVMTAQNCVEIYFPKLLNFTNTSRATSTAHPLQQALLNEGFQHCYSNCDAILEPLVDSYYDSNAIIVDEDHMSQNTNIIIARPYRRYNQYQDVCNYNQYDGIDFTNFLGQ